MRFTAPFAGLVCCSLWAVGLFAADPQRGYRLLTETAYLPPDFDQETFDQVWRQWPEPLRAQAERATPEERRNVIASGREDFAIWTREIVVA